MPASQEALELPVALFDAAGPFCSARSSRSTSSSVSRIAGELDGLPALHDCFDQLRTQEGEVDPRGLLVHPEADRPIKNSPPFRNGSLESMDRFLDP
jgi:hypothetical protein